MKDIYEKVFEKYDKKFYSKTDRTCLWHRNDELRIFIRQNLIPKEVVIELLEGMKQEEHCLTKENCALIYETQTLSQAIEAIRNL